MQFSLILNIINQIINIFVILFLIYSFYNLYIEHKNYKQFDKDNITKSTDIDTIGEQYNDCQLYKLYNSLTDRDKEYLFHIINASRIKYKEDKPKFDKQKKTLRNQIFTNMGVSFLVKNKASAVFDTLKYNTLLTAFS